MPSDESRIKEQAKFTYSPFGKSFEKQIKAIEDQGIKQVEALKALKQEENQELESVKGRFPKKTRKNEIKNEIYDIKKWEEKVNLEDLIHSVNKYKHDFRQYETISSFGESIYTGKIAIDEADMDQSNLLKIW